MGFSNYFFTTFRKGGEMSLRQQENKKEKTVQLPQLNLQVREKWSEKKRLTPKPTAGPTRQILTSDGERRASTVRQCRCLPDHSFKQAAARVKQRFIFLRWRYWMANTNNSRRAATMAEHRSIITVTRFLLSPLYEHTCAVETAEAERRSCCQDLRGKKKKSCFQGWTWMGSERRWTWKKAWK